MELCPIGLNNYFVGGNISIYWYNMKSMVLHLIRKSIYLSFFMQFCEKHFSNESVLGITAEDLRTSRMRVAKHLLLYQGKH
jgi:hypothetical protein